MYLSEVLEAMDEPKNHFQFLRGHILRVVVDCFLQNLLIVHSAPPCAVAASSEGHSLISFLELLFAYILSFVQYNKSDITSFRVD